MIEPTSEGSEGGRMGDSAHTHTYTDTDKPLIGLSLLSPIASAMHSKTIGSIVCLAPSVSASSVVLTTHQQQSHCLLRVQKRENYTVVRKVNETNERSKKSKHKLNE